jgi:glutaredoxin
MTLPGRPTRFMPQVLVLGRDTCEDTLESRRFLTREKVPFQYLSWEHDPETEAAIRAFNDGEVVTPTIIIGDPAAPTKVMVEPTFSEMERAMVVAGGGY